MKKSIINYVVSWKKSGCNFERICFRKSNAVYEYLDIMRDSVILGISELKILEMKKDGTANDITEDVNKFLEK